MRPLLAPTERLEGLQALTAALSAALTQGEVTDVLLAHARGLVDAEAVAVLRLSENRGALEATGAVGFPGTVVREWGRVPMDRPSALQEAVATGRIVVVDPTSSSKPRAGIEQLAAGTLAVVPLGARPDREPNGVLVFGFDGDRALDDADRRLLGTVGELYGEAFERALLFETAEAERRRLGTLMRELPVGVAIAEAPSGDIIAVNEKAFEIWRLPKAPFVRITDVSGFKAFHPDGTRIKESEWPLARSLATGELVQGEVLDVEFGDGSRGQVSISSRPIDDGQGRRLGAVTTLVDVTENHRREARARFMAGASEVLASSLDPDETLRRFAQLAVPALADWCTVHIREGHAIRLAAVAHRDASRIDQAVEYDLRYPAAPGDRTGVAEVIRSGRSQLAETITRSMLESTGRDEGFVRLAYDDLALRSALIVPLAARGKTFGALALLAAESGRRFGADDIAFAEEFASHAALAVDNARLYAEQADIASTLQRSLLPHRLPDIEGIEVVTRYRPAGGAGSLAGGDFFDLWDIDGEQFGFAIGDVCGKGPAAAAFTALMRHTVRTASICLPSHAPVDVLRKLNDAAVKRLPFGRFGTVVYGLARRDAEGIHVTLGAGGHPRPYVVRAGSGEVTQPGVGGPLVGVEREIHAPEYIVSLRPGDRLVLFTDGVTERRDRGRLFGEHRLIELLADIPAHGADAVAGRIEQAVTTFSPDPPQDDIALLILGPI
ncbi:MAG TPA: SpoIIE family protein phosphatase [Thermoleophilia bacterium]|nr:SpoIIE family protein phosphatase [Thermoleophilia bacterium]